MGLFCLLCLGFWLSVLWTAFCFVLWLGLFVVGVLGVLGLLVYGWGLVWFVAGNDLLHLITVVVWGGVVVGFWFGCGVRFGV